MTLRSPRRPPITLAESQSEVGGESSGQDTAGRVETFLESLEREQYRALAGLSEDTDLDAIYQRFSDLFNRELFDRIEPPRGGSIDDDRRAFLREFLAHGIEGYETRGQQDRFLAEEVAANVVVDGEEIGYRALPVRVRQEEDRDHRRALEKARLSVARERLEPIAKEAITSQHRVAAELLGASYDEYSQTLARLDFDALERETEVVLERTLDAQRDLLEYFAGRLAPGVAPDALESHDLSRLQHGVDFNALFPEGRMVDRVGGFVSAMGLDLTAEGRIELDLEKRPLKSPRAFCAAIRVPDEVKLVIQPYGSHDDYGAFLHELGHALHFANVDRALPVEFRRLGDNGVTEAYAMTFDHLMLVPAFLKQVMEIARPEEFLRFSTFLELTLLRRYAAKFGYERILHREGPGGATVDEYVKRLTGATGVRTSPELYLIDVDPQFYCVRYLRAWMLTGVIHKELRERFDEDWFRNPRTGPFLRELWALGQSLPVEDLAREWLGHERLTFSPLLAMIDERL